MYKNRMNTLSKRPLSSSFNELTKRNSMSRDNELHYLKSYTNLTEIELMLLHKKAYQNLREMFRKNSNDIRESVLKSIEAISRGKTKKWKMLWKKDKKQTVFGVPLTTSLDYASVYVDSIEGTNNKKIPIVVYECINYLRTHGLKKEGIFRVNGSERRINVSIKVFDETTGYGFGYSFDGMNVFDVASLLKLYLRQLPEPLIPYCLYNTTLKCIKIFENEEERVKAFQYLLMMLPSAHLVLLEVLLQFLSEVIEYSDDNHMNSHNLACIFAPNLLRKKENMASSTTMLSSTDEYEVAFQVLEFLINHKERFFISSSEVKPFQLCSNSVKDELMNINTNRLSPITIKIDQSNDNTPTTPSTTSMTPPLTTHSAITQMNGLSSLQAYSLPRLNTDMNSINNSNNNNNNNNSHYGGSKSAYVNNNLEIPSPINIKPKSPLDNVRNSLNDEPYRTLNTCSLVSTSLNRLNYLEMQMKGDDFCESEKNQKKNNGHTKLNSEDDTSIDIVKSKTNINNIKTMNNKSLLSNNLAKLEINRYSESEKNGIYSLLSPLSTNERPVFCIPPPPLSAPPTQNVQ